MKTCIHICIAMRLGSAWWREFAREYMGDDVGPTVAELLAALDEGGGVQGDDKWKRLGAFPPPTTHMARTFARSSRACWRIRHARACTVEWLAGTCFPRADTGCCARSLLIVIRAGFRQVAVVLLRQTVQRARGQQHWIGRGGRCGGMRCADVLCTG